MGTLNVRVSAETECWLEAFAKGRGTTKSNIAREAISAFRSSFESFVGVDEEGSDVMTAAQCAQLIGILEREDVIVDGLVWEAPRRSFQRVCFPAAFRRLQREKIRPAFELFAARFDRSPKRAGWRLWIGEACPPPNIVSYSLNGDVDFYSSQPIGEFEPVEKLYFSWSPGIIRDESALNSNFSILPDCVNAKFVPSIVVDTGEIIYGHPLSLEEITSHRIYDLILESFDIIATNLHNRLHNDLGGGRSLLNLENKQPGVRT